MPVYPAKPTVAVPDPAILAGMGARLYLPLNEGAGTRARDYSAAQTPALWVGSPTWQMGRVGPRVAGFTTTDYLAIDPPTQVMGAIYPCWMAALVVNAVTAGGVILSQGRSTAVSSSFRIAYNLPATGNVQYLATDDANTAANLSATAAVNDDLPHVVMGASYAANDHRLYFDGVLVATATTALGTASGNLLTVGLHRRNTVVNPFGGAVIWAGAGNRIVPNPVTLARDVFAAVRWRRRVECVAGAAIIQAVGGGFKPAWAARVSNTFLIGGAA